MKILVFQHLAAEHPGVFRDFLRADSIPWDAVELDQGESIPSFEGYDALMVFGGPMDVWQEERHPWLVAEKAGIRAWVTQKRAPFLGVCLGHQLLADALGGTVGPMRKPEVGVFEVKLTAAGRAAALFEGMPASFPVLQWHGAEVRELPPGGEHLAENEHCAIQALRVGENAYGLQCHVETDERTVAEWSNIAEYRCALETMLGRDGQARLAQAAHENAQAFDRAARTIYRNFRRLLAG